MLLVTKKYKSELGGIPHVPLPNMDPWREKEPPDHNNDMEGLECKGSVGVMSSICPVCTYPEVWLGLCPLEAGSSWWSSGRAWCLTVVGDL